MSDYKYSRDGLVFRKGTHPQDSDDFLGVVEKVLTPVGTFVWSWRTASMGQTGWSRSRKAAIESLVRFSEGD